MKQIVAVACLCFGLSAQAAPQQKVDLLWDRFAADVADVEKGLDGVLGVAVLDLASGRTFLLHADEVFPQASSIKITVLAELYRQSEQGKAKLNDPYVVQASDIVQDSDIMGGLTPGVTTLTNRDLATMLATHKDSWIPRLLPEGTKIADKPGELEGVRADSGVVFLDNRPYVICIMTTYLGKERAGEDAISRISEAAWRLFDRLARSSEYGRVVSVSNGH